MIGAERLAGPRRSVELLHQLEEAAHQTDDLETERRALMEILARLRVDEQALLVEATEVERKCALLESQVAEETTRNAQIARDISELEQQAALARGRAVANARHLDLLMRELMSLEQAVCDEQREISLAQMSLGGTVACVLRLDYKLRFHGM
jgi:chromosome segregation ATPase